MRHGKKINHLGRTDTHRKAMLANMATSLILHKRVNTTVAKAKALRIYVEPLLTKAKNDTTHTRRTVFSYLQSKESVTELFREVAVKIADRPGGYTRIIKTGNRLGDNAEMCFIELVDYNELYSQGQGEEKKEKTTRRGRSRGKKAGAKAEGQAVAAASDEGAVAAEAAPAASEETAAVEAAPVVSEETAAAEEVKEETVAETAEETAAVEEGKEETAEETPAAESPAPEEAAPAEPEEAARAESEKVKAEDLKKIEGIGPKIEEVLLAAGVTTFALLAEKSEEELKAMLGEAGDQFVSHDPATWPKQAELAAAGKWDELKKLQDELLGGREDKKED